MAVAAVIRVLVALLACVPAGASAETSTGMRVYDGPGYVYDVPAIARVDVGEFRAPAARPVQVSEVFERSASPLVEVRGPSMSAVAAFIATEYGGGALPENLSASDATRIQNAANKVGVPITVVGSRAAGTSHAWSDWDYIVSGANSRIRGKIRNSLPEGPRGIGEPRKIDFIEGPVNTDFPYITFNPC
jgi:hypothetical protein